MHQLQRLHLNENTSDLRFAIESFLKNSDIALLRLAHRVNDIRHIKRFLPKLQKLLLRNPLPLRNDCGSLGISVKKELEDISFSVLHPRYFQKYRKNFVHLLVLIQHFSTKQKVIRREIGKENLPSQLHGRTKGIYSAHKNSSFTTAHFENSRSTAIRIITESEKDCYQILRIVHRLFPPLFLWI